MGRLAIRKVIYNGDKYYFESPILKDGINIIEAPNGHGKSTFMDLIYFGLGGKISSFDSNSRGKKHKEIVNDSNNYVELLIEINSIKYEVTRYFSENRIYILDNNSNVINCVISRRTERQDEDPVFSDWIMMKLGFSVFDLVQGTKVFKINFNDVFRLIYHDQVTEIDRIYKEADNSNFLTDSQEIRKAIFEVLIGKHYNDYYDSLGKFKMLQKQLEIEKGQFETYDNFLSEVIDKGCDDIIAINKSLEDYNIRLEILNNENERIISSVDTGTEISNKVTEYKRELILKESIISEEYKSKNVLLNTINKLNYLINESKRELYEIEKIRLVNRKLKLFTPNSCPYCLTTVAREEGKCICGTTVDEEQYEKFFYTDSEYLEIINSKQKNLSTLRNFLNNKNEQLNNLNSRIDILNARTNELKSCIIDLTKDIDRKDSRILLREQEKARIEILNNISKLHQSKELIHKKDELAKKAAQTRSLFDKAKARTDRLLAEANEDMLLKRERFSNVYQNLMQKADLKCHDAYIEEDYMPSINFSEYRERSASVPKRLMYFFALLILSLDDDISFPKLLLVDTPNKEGIDLENLRKNIGLLSSEILENDLASSYQIILTTGVDTYPVSLLKNVILRLEKGQHLLTEKIQTIV